MIEHVITAIISISISVILCMLFMRNSTNSAVNNEKQETETSLTRATTRATTVSPNIQMNLGDGNLTARTINAGSNIAATGNVSAAAVSATGNVSAAKFCVGGSCIDERHINMLNGSADTFFVAPNGNGTMKVDGTWTNGHRIYYSTSKSPTHSNFRMKSSWP